MVLGLFSAVFRRLRAFRVRPLDSEFAVQVPNGFLKVGDNVDVRLSSGPADVFDGIPQVEAQAPGLDYFNRLVDRIPAIMRRMVDSFHVFKFRPARARRQPQTVLEPRFKRQNIIILTLLALTAPLYAQNGFIGDLYQETSASVSAPFNNSNPRYNSWVVMYSYVGSGNFSVELDCAQDATTPGGTQTPSTFTTCANAVTGSNPATQAGGNYGYITFVGYTPWLETKINSIASGSITVVAFGYLASPPDSGGSGSGGCAGTASTPCIVAGPNTPGTASTKNPVQVAGNDGTDVRAIATDASGRTKAVGSAATGASPVGNPVNISGLDGAGNVLPVVQCTSSIVVNVSSMGENQVIALSAGKTIRVCDVDLSFPAPAAFSVQVDYGTGSNCATGTGHLTGIYTFNSAVLGFFLDPGALAPLVPPQANAVCLNLSAGVTVQGTISYAIPF